MTQHPQTFNAVCFDCDSTLSTIEGIDELALKSGVIDQIAPLTRAAMEGGLNLDEIYGKRLELVRPSKADIEWLATRYIDEMVPGTRKTVTSLQSVGKNVFIISGGLRQAILKLAQTLNIPPQNVHAVDITFKSDGTYEGFDDTSPLITPLGKATICKTIIDAHGPTAMIGDGLTDVAANKAGAYVIGFGGVENRAIVKQRADHFIDTPDLTATLQILLNEKERAALKNGPTS